MAWEGKGVGRGLENARGSATRTGGSICATYASIQPSSNLACSTDSAPQPGHCMQGAQRTAGGHHS